MPQLTIGDGKHVGDWDIIGNGQGFDVRRLDPCKTNSPNQNGRPVWTVVASASNVQLAVEALKIVMQQDLMLMMRKDR